jgi:hypothetical protein
MNLFSLNKRNIICDLRPKRASARAPSLAVSRLCLPDRRSTRGARWRRHPAGVGALHPRLGAASVARALAAVDVKDFARHKAGRFQIEDRVDDVGNLAHMANRVQRAQLRMHFDRVHRRVDDARRNSVHPDTALRILDSQ